MSLRKIFFGVTLIWGCMLSVLTMAANIRDYPRVAVMNFGNKAITSSGLRNQDMSSATEYAIYQLSASGWFDLIDYEQLNNIAAMHNINMSGLVDQGTAVQIGKFAGAQYMIVGYVTGLTTKENVAAVQAYTASAGNAQHVVTANVSVRIVDIETGRIVAAGLGRGSSTSTMTEVGFKLFRNREDLVSKVVDSTVKRKKVNEGTANYGSRRTADSDTGLETNNYNYNESKKNSGSNGYTNVANSENGSYYNDSVQTKERGSLRSNEDGYRETTSTVRAGYENTDNRNASGNSYSNDSYNANQGGTRIRSEGPFDGIITENTGNKDMHYDLHQYSKDGSYEIYRDYQNADRNANSGSAYNYDAKQKGSAYSDSSGREVDARSKRADISYDSSTVKNGNTAAYNHQQQAGASAYSDQYSNNINSQNVRTKQNQKVYTDDYVQGSANVADNVYSTDKERKYYTYEREEMTYGIKIGAVKVSDVQARNAISKAVRDAIYGKTGLLTTLNGGKQLKIKTGF